MADNIVMDTGSGQLKFGFPGEDMPKFTEPNYQGIPKYDKIINDGAEEIFQCRKAEEKRAICTIQQPVVDGIIKDWEKMERIWDFCYTNRLKVQSEEYGCLNTEPPLNPEENKKKMGEVYFENFKVPRFYVHIQAVLSLFSAGKTTGTVLDMGDGVCHTVPVIDGYINKVTVCKNFVAGRAMTEALCALIRQASQIPLDQSNEREFIKEVKEKYCYVASDPVVELEEQQGGKKAKVDVKLPDEKVIQLGKELQQCPEVMFDTKLGQNLTINREQEPIHKLVHKSVERVDIEARKQQQENIILSGGSSMYQGIDARLEAELSKLVAQTMKVKVIAQKERKYSVWIGGSVLASLSTFKNQWITKAEYEESGSNIMIKKCI